MKKLLTLLIISGIFISVFYMFDMNLSGEDILTTEIEIDDFSFKNRKLSFRIKDYKLQSFEKKLLASIQIKIKISDKGEKEYYDQTKSLKTEKNEMKISIPFFKLEKGKYIIHIEAKDLHTEKIADLTRSVKIKKKKLQETDNGKFSISYSWLASTMCEEGRSPKINLLNVPEGTSFLMVKVSDLDKRSFDHGGGRVRYKGKKYIRSGALRNYFGPCPPQGTTHRYSIIVQAINTSNKLIGVAEYVQSCGR